jgi:hypothetical protein
VILAALAAAPAGLARQIPLTVLHTASLRGRVLPDPADGGGLLRLASALRAARAETAHCLLIDTGDFFLGSAEAAATGGRVSALALATFAPDVLVPAARDFALGPATLRTWLGERPPRLLAANLPAEVAEPFTFFAVDGLQVLVVGLTQSDGALHLRPEQAPGAVFAPARETLQRLLPALRERRADLRILVLHAGDPTRPGEARDLLQAFPDFDLVLGGRAGQAVAAHRPGDRGPLYAEAGEGGEHLGRVDLVYDNVRRQVVRLEGSLVPVGNRREADGDLRQALQRELDRAAALLDAPAPPPPVPADEEQVHLWLATRPLRDQGPTRRIRFEEFPVDEPVGSFLCAAHALEQALAAAPPEAWARLWCQGLAWERTGERFRLLAPDGTPLNPRKRLSVSANAHLLASAGGGFAALRQLAEQQGVRFAGAALHERLGLTPPPKRRS